MKQKIKFVRVGPLGNEAKYVEIDVQFVKKLVIRGVQEGYSITEEANDMLDSFKLCNYFLLRVSSHFEQWLSYHNLPAFFQPILGGSGFFEVHFLDENLNTIDQIYLPFAEKSRESEINLNQKARLDKEGDLEIEIEGGFSFADD